MARASLIASTYRSERFLSTWMRSLEASTIWGDCELVVVANEPTALEQELLRGFADKHPQTRVVTVPREPLYRSWNRAIAETTSPLLAIANVDDLRTPDGLAEQVAALERDRDALFAYGPFSISRTFPPSDGALRTVPAREFDREVFTRGMMLGPFFVWRRTAHPGLVQFDEQLLVGGDFDLAVRLALHGRGVAVGARLGVYYDGGTGLSTRGDRQAIEGTVLCLRYGIYDRVDYSLVADAVAYRIPDLLLPDGRWLSLAEAVPGYEALLAERRARWHQHGLRRGAFRERPAMRTIREAARRIVRLKHRLERLVGRRAPDG
jgi:hypothetical protein